MHQIDARVTYHEHLDLQIHLIHCMLGCLDLDWLTRPSMINDYQNVGDENGNADFLSLQPTKLRVS